MSVRAIAWVWEHSESIGNDRLVLLAIADCANDEGRHAWPAVTTLARKTKLHVRTIERCLQRLRYRYDELTWTSRDGHSNDYRLTKILLTAKQLKTHPGTPGKLPGVTPGILPDHPRQDAGPTPGRMPDDPYVRTRTGTGESTAAVPPWLSESVSEAAYAPLGDEIAASSGGHPQVLRRVAWERLVECFGDAGGGIGTRAADCPASVTALIEWLSGQARDLKIPASDEHIVRAAKSMWNAHWEQTHGEQTNATV